LGTIKTPEPPSNCNWGDDGKTLYITAVTSVYRIKLAVAGAKALYQ
jgi:gluconolactonase